MRKNVVSHSDATTTLHPVRISIQSYLTLLLFLACLPLFSQSLALQSFENTASDTWAYTANPASFTPYFWGRTNQPQGGATAQNGPW